MCSRPANSSRVPETFTTVTAASSSARKTGCMPGLLRGACRWLLVAGGPLFGLALGLLGVEPGGLGRGGGTAAEPVRHPERAGRMLVGVGVLHLLEQVLHPG